MKLVQSNKLADEFEKWFSYSIYDQEIDGFNDFDVFERALQIFKFDYLRYYPDDKSMSIINIKRRLELVGILLYRVAREFYLIGDQKCDYYSLLGRCLSGFEIYYTAEIGKGLKINHGLGTVVGARVKIGENCLLHQNVTFGDKNNGRPVIGDNVTVYSGAKILGQIRIGNESIIGANAVCFIDAPNNSRIVGVPAKII